MEDTLKCARCSAPILDGEMVMRYTGDWVHVRCLRVLTSDSRVRESRALTRKSWTLVESGQERIERTFPLGERRTVRCVVCGELIDGADNVVIDSSGPAHAHCLKGNSTA